MRINHPENTWGVPETFTVGHPTNTVLLQYRYQSLRVRLPYRTWLISHYSIFNVVHCVVATKQMMIFECTDLRLK